MQALPHRKEIFRNGPVLSSPGLRTHSLGAAVPTSLVSSPQHEIQAWESCLRSLILCACTRCSWNKKRRQCEHSSSLVLKTLALVRLVKAPVCWVPQLIVYSAVHHLGQFFQSVDFTLFSLLCPAHFSARAEYVLSLKYSGNWGFLRLITASQSPVFWVFSLNIILLIKTDGHYHHFTKPDLQKKKEL